MASKTPTYGKDLPGNIGTQDVLRAIYDKVSDSSASVVIEEKLDTIIYLTNNVNNNILINTVAVKENTEAINQSINNLDNSVKDGFDKTIDAIKETKPAPRPIPPCPPRPHPHPHPHPVPPKPYYSLYSRTNLSTDYYSHYYGLNQPLFYHQLDPYGPQPIPDEALYVVNDIYNNMIYNLDDSF